MTSLSTAIVTFYDKYGYIVAEQTYSCDFFTADWSVIKECAEKWADSHKDDFGAESYSIC